MVNCLALVTYTELSKAIKRCIKYVHYWLKQILSITNRYGKKTWKKWMSQFAYETLWIKKRYKVNVGLWYFNATDMKSCKPLSPEHSLHKFVIWNDKVCMLIGWLCGLHTHNRLNWRLAHDVQGLMVLEQDCVLEDLWMNLTSKLLKTMFCCNRQWYMFILIFVLRNLHY